MILYLVRRALGSLLVLLVVSLGVFCYVASHYDPLKPFRQISPPKSAAFMRNQAHIYHLDQPVLVRYWNWLRHLVGPSSNFPFIRFNFGSDVRGAAISTQLAQRLEVTTRLALAAIVLAAVLAVVLGVISGVRRDKPIDAGVTVLTFILIALPTFWFAAVLKEVAINLNNNVFHDHVIQTTFDETPGLEDYGTGSQILHDQVTHLLLPALSLGFLTAASWIRYQRASTIEVLDADYLRLARAKGLRNRTVIRRHGLRNALIPLVTIMAIDIGGLFGGAVITEKVYAWHGMGDFLNNAFLNEDSYAVIGWVMVTALFVVTFNVLADVLYAVLDPRIRLS